MYSLDHADAICRPAARRGLSCCQHARRFVRRINHRSWSELGRRIDVRRRRAQRREHRRGVLRRREKIGRRCTLGGMPILRSHDRRLVHRRWARVRIWNQRSPFLQHARALHWRLVQRDWSRRGMRKRARRGRHVPYVARSDRSRFELPDVQSGLRICRRVMRLRLRGSCLGSMGLRYAGRFGLSCAATEARLGLLLERSRVQLRIVHDPRKSKHDLRRRHLVPSQRRLSTLRFQLRLLRAHARPRFSCCAPRRVGAPAAHRGDRCTRGVRACLRSS